MHAPRLLSFTSRRQRGSALLLAMALVLAIAVIGAAVLKIAGGDRILAGRLGLEDRGRACAEAGIQYGRRLFGSSWVTSLISDVVMSLLFFVLFDRLLDVVLPTGLLGDLL